MSTLTLETVCDHNYSVYDCEFIDDDGCTHIRMNCEHCGRSHEAIFPAMEPEPEITSVSPVKVKHAPRRKPDPRYMVPGTAVSLLSNPSKMPGYAYGMMAGTLCPFKVDSSTKARFIALILDPIKRREYEDSLICNHCYAQKGRYVFASVVRSHQTRYDFLRRSMRENDGREFVWHMVQAIRKYCRGEMAWFRIHDSADFFSAEYTRLWIEICRQCPDVNFWAPTKSHRAPWVAVLKELHALPNVCISPSADSIHDEPPVIDGLGAGSFVVPTIAEATCKAKLNAGHCGDCRACWIKDRVRSYPLH